MKKTVTWMTWLSLSAVSPVALAISLGQASVSSYLNAPLDASIPLLESSDHALDDIRVSIAEPSAFAAAGLEWTPLAASVRVQVEEHQGRRQVRLSSGQSMEEPWLELLFTLEYPGGQQTRDVTLLFDPQGYSQQESSQHYSQQGASNQSQSQTAAPSVVPVALKASTAQSTTTETSGTNNRAPRNANSVYVGRGDTLWSVAERIKPGEASVQQMMVALREANPDVFPSGNINDMRAGQMLRIPAAERVLARSHGDADAAIKAMNEAWRSRRDGPLQAVSLPEVEPAPVADTAIAAAQTLHANALAHSNRALAAGDSEAVTDESGALSRRELTEQLLLSQSTLQQVLEERELMHAELNELRGEVASLTQSLSSALASQEQPAQEQSSEPLAASMDDTDSPDVAALIERYQWPLALGTIVLLVGLLVWLRKRREETWEDIPLAEPVVKPTVSPHTAPKAPPMSEAASVTTPSHKGDVDESLNDSGLSAASQSESEPEPERPKPEQPGPEKPESSAEAGAPATNAVPTVDTDQWLAGNQGPEPPQEETLRYEKSQASGLAEQVRQRRMGLTVVPVARAESVTLAPPPNSVRQQLASLETGLPASDPLTDAGGQKTDKPTELTKDPGHRFIDYHRRF
ncbi:MULTISPECIES: FimV family protein [unclassified Halomonas]|uniref:type IV pilus assembly protein FimV n=1 Tax=unclassified Halomonas TaxID=2609666 RepID=UPI001CF2475A|nr:MULTISPECIES: FimV/HubP family polar landmark protein [unclassified Halomonas]UZH08168.1 hypothetical protein OM794_12220 [Halomonas sp. BDJS001]